MKKTDLSWIRFHEDAVLFREAVNFTAARTGFPARLIEKDYFCTLLLAYLSPEMSEQVVFKGGTCLTKVLVGFYRLSEDLDFAISLPVDSSRASRSRCVETMKVAVGEVVEAVPGFRLLRPLQGANNSMQYVGAVGYDSPVTGQVDTIRIEISLREPLLMPVLNGSAETILLDPITGRAMVPSVVVPCISKTEALAEKTRAALTRRAIAIRDFYDIDHAVEVLGINPHDPELAELIQRKLAVPGNGPLNSGLGRRDELRRQLDTRLRPALRQEDFDRFDLDRAIHMVNGLARSAGDDYGAGAE